MPLDAGTRLGPFEVQALLGAGAMGEVYRARDTRLGRDVAVKVLVPALAADAASVERFSIEARAVAALSHPNIVALYDIGQDGATIYVVTELLEGATLRERLSRGALPARKAVEYTRQIAVALAAAHQRGIVHRDLKPDNVFVTADGRVKVLDFGIAQMSKTPFGPESATLAGTETAVAGTVGYMAPEQVRGLAVDHRADIFAIGCVLYELLTGRGPFARATPADTISALLNDDPAPVPVDGLDRIVRRCLEKSPAERFQSASDLAFALDVAPGDAGTARPARAAGRLPVLVAAAAAIAGIALVAGFLAGQGRREAGATPQPQMPARFGIPAVVTWSDAASVSPDGRYLVYTGGVSSGGSAPTSVGTESRATGAATSGRFWLRRLDSHEINPFGVTEAADLFWSPDSRRLGFRAGQTILIRDVPDGEARVVAELAEPPQGIAWSRRGVLLIALGDGLYQLPADGGTPRLVSRTEPGKEVRRGAPSFLPDGDRFLFTVRHNGGGEDALETRVGTLAGAELATLGRGMVGAMYADGHVLFGARGGLYARPFDLSTLAFTGDAVQLGDRVAQDWRSGRLAAYASDTGVLVYRAAPKADTQFTLVDRFGRTVRTIGAPDSFTNFSLSPDEQRLVVARRHPVTAQTSLWLIDVARGVTSLVTAADDPQDADDPTWAPDGRHVAYRHGSRLVLRPANGGSERTLLEAEAYPDSFSPDGRFVVYGVARSGVFEQWTLDIMTPGATPAPLVGGVSLADEGRIAPGGTWLAYHSNESGGAQVYVMPFPRTGEKWQVSQKGGVQPRWSADGHELFYLDPDGRLMAVSLPGSDPRRARAPEVLFSTGLVPSDALDQYAPTKNGFVMRAPVSAGVDAGAVQVIVNWPSLQRRGER
jgi:Tol biopolymer transport system component